MNVGDQGLRVRGGAGVKLPGLKSPIVESVSLKTGIKPKRDKVCPVSAAGDAILDRDVWAFHGDAVILKRITAISSQPGVISTHDDPIIAPGQFIMAARAPFEDKERPCWRSPLRIERILRFLLGTERHKIEGMPAFDRRAGRA